MKYFVLNLLIIFITFSLTLSAADSEQEPNKEKVNQEIKKSTKDSKPQNQVENREKAPEPEKLLKVGNLSFPVSQQPNPLISFGQNLLNKKQAQAFVLTNEFKGKGEYFINIVPSILYGFTDDLSIFISVPIAARYRQKDHHSSGPEDLIVQLEYALWTKENYTYYDQITILTNVTIPTGSAKKKPRTGIGSNSFFIGGTYSRMAINWFYFISSGGVLTTSSHRTKFGDQFFYQSGLGRRIASTKEWLFAWIVEFDGTYSWKDKIQGVTDPNSGGNIIYLTPSLFISSKESLLVQLGIGVPIQQHLFGRQNRKEYLLSLNVGWTF